ncbi:amino acid deaminase/aldolase [Skermania sp. ID1734]|uniref:amino acid deaminase/aldolase n=1 Tax=Skermania sp. ID1734 TaxID=2597516 RepID=UPI00117FDBC8|nr:amino acid deaminase/aldolase [Skermania sp. ID1734]TSE02206.1 amino acid deaminase/aldolase [Skermania sp. ID1734]
MREVVARLDAATRSLDPPFAAVDMTTVEANAADLVRRASGLPIRVASKSVRCRAVLQRVLGPELSGRDGFRGLMTFSLREAIWLVRQGADDVLMGYPTVDRVALAEYAADSRLVERITLMLDDPAQLDVVRSVGGAAVVPRVCLDVDASLRIGRLHLGARRSPVRTPEQAADLARQVVARGGSVAGVMTYEAQIAGLPDSNPAVVLVKKASAREIGGRRRAVVAAVRDVVGDLAIVNSGGSGSIEVSVEGSDVTEVTAGSGLFVPALFDDYRSFAPRPALLFATSVVRRPAAGIATVFGGGYVASGAAGKSRLPVPAWPQRLRLLGAEGAGEVQTPVAGSAAEDLSVGDRVWFRHAKAGEVCERFTHLHLVEADGSVTAAPTYRGEGMCFG